MKIKTRITVLAALLCVALTADLHAQPPNAWQINDNLTTSGFIQYVTNLTASQVSVADANGWRYDVVGRLVSSSTNAAQSMAFGDGTRRFYIFLGLNTSGQLTAQLLGDTTYTLSDAAEATNYHTHELTYDPVTSNATYQVDGVTIASWPGQVSAGQSNQVMWGANYSLGEGIMNYHHAQFEIMGQGIVADYDAGVAGNPSVAPYPTNQAWTRYTTGVIPEGPVSPDAVALPSLATTLAASDMWAHSAALNARLQPDGLTTEYHFEFGLTTNYGSFSATNTLTAGTFAGVFSNVVNGLLADSTYHFRVVASNSRSEVTGQDMSFKTSLSTVVSSPADSGPGTLRAAVAFANTNVAGTAITFDPALAGQTIVLTSGELVLTNSASVDASALPGGIAISGNHSSRILFADSGTVTVDVTLDSLTLINGNGIGQGAGDGGAIFTGGTLMLLTLNNCALTGNSAVNDGGGIYYLYSSILTLNNCTLAGNSATEYGGGIYGTSQGMVTINNSTLSSNSANNGGGIYSVSGSGGMVSISNSTLSSNFAALSGGGIYSAHGTLTLNHSTLIGNSAPYGGAGIYIDDYAGTFAINNCTFSGNTATNTDFGGGGVRNGATLTINSSLFTGNFAADGSGIYNSAQGLIILNNSTLSGNADSPLYNYHGGGGVYNEGDIVISNSIFSGNSTHAGGGGIYNDFNGSIMLNNSTLSNNYSAYGGGGIYDYRGTVALNNCHLTGNSAPSGGGGIVEAEGMLTINNSTLSGNSATNGQSSYGGGVYNYDGTVTIKNCTLSGNSAPSGGGGICDNYQGTITINNSTLSSNSTDGQFGSGGGIYIFSNVITHVTGSVKLTNSIVAGNTAGSDPNIFGSFSGSHCLINDNPLLAPLGDYGGPTQTMPPLAGSPAIDAGRDSVTSFLTTDQRGYPRLSGAHVDIGAVEAQYAPANNPPVLMNSIWSSPGSSNSFQFTFANVPDADFTVLASTNLALPLADWTPIGNAAQNPPGQYQFADPGATNYLQRFYQVVSP